MKQPNARGVVTFVCDEVPSYRTNGQSSYNLDIVRATMACGLAVHLVITGNRLSKIAEPIPEGVAVATYVNAWRLKNWLIPKSRATLLRLIQEQIAKFSSPSASKPDAKQANIGRFLTAKEAAATRHSIAPGSRAVFVDTIFRSNFLTGEHINPVLIEHDLFAKRTSSFQRNGYTVAPSITRAAEDEIYSRFSAAIAISEDDEAAIRENFRGPTATIFPVGAAASSAVVNRAQTGMHILYIGSGGQHNVDGLTWFFDKVWHKVLDLVPDARLHVVGSIAAHFAVVPPSVTFHGRLNSVATVANRCSIAINPLKMGSGIKIKMMDYFNFGLACVVTPVGAEGFPSPANAPFVIAEQPNDFAAQIQFLLGRDLERAALEHRIPDYLEKFSAETARRKVADLLNEISARNDR